MNSETVHPAKARESVDEQRRLERFINWLTFGSAVVFISVEVGAVALYCWFLPSGRWPAFAAAVMVATATVLVGALAGFLFGIPRALTTDTSGGRIPRRRGFLENTNLEQVSDWLTKIIVGVSLIQFHNIIRGVQDLAKTVAPIFGSTSTQNQVMAGALIIYSAAFGFLATYIGTRTTITVLFYRTPSLIGEEGSAQPGAEWSGSRSTRSPMEGGG